MYLHPASSFLLQCPAARILKLIDGNKGKITENLETLDKLLYTPKGWALLDSIKQDRAAYVASFSKVIKLFREGDRDGGKADAE